LHPAAPFSESGLYVPTRKDKNKINEDKKILKRNKIKIEEYS
jgi:hypothetical protein